LPGTETKGGRLPDLVGSVHPLVIPRVLWHTINMKNETASVTTLSPAAQAVMDAFLSEWDVCAISEARWATAAALRAAADQVVPMGDYNSGEVMLIAMNVRTNFLAIAAELEGR
jgi:hypothetical protein